LSASPEHAGPAARRRKPHRCDETCLCAVHGTALIYSPALDDHACQDPSCKYAHGGAPVTDPESVAAFLARHRADQGGETDYIATLAELRKQTERAIREAVNEGGMTVFDLQQVTGRNWRYLVEVAGKLGTEGEP
jgi:hypothetical protein